MKVPVQILYSWNTIKTRDLQKIDISYDVYYQLGDTDIICRFRILLGGKTGKRYPSYQGQSFKKLDQIQKTAPLGVAQGRYSRFIFVEHYQQHGKSPVSQILGRDRLFCFITICKLDSFKNSFAMITSLSELSFKFRIFFLLVHTKN